MKTKTDIQRNGIELVKMFGTSIEKNIKMGGIDII